MRSSRRSTRNPRSCAPTASGSQGVIAAAEAEIDDELANEDAARAEQAAAVPDALIADYERRRAQNKGAGAARLVGTSCTACHLSIPSTEAETHPQGRGRRRRLLRQLRRDPRPVTQASLPFAGDAAANPVDELTLYCDGGSRGNPGPAAIGAVVFDATVDPPRAGRVGERAHRHHDQQRGRVQGADRRSRGGCPSARAGRARPRRFAPGGQPAKRPSGRSSTRTCARCTPRRARCSAAYDVVDLQHVPREENTEADALVNAALDAIVGRGSRWCSGWRSGRSSACGTSSRAPVSTFASIALGALHAAGARCAVRRTGLCAHLALGRRRAGRRDGGDVGTRPAAPPAPVPEPGDRLVLGSRARGVVGAPKRCSGGRRSAPACPRAALLAPWPVVVVEELLGLAAAWWAWTRFGLADPRPAPRVVAHTGGSRSW